MLVLGHILLAPLVLPSPTSMQFRFTNITVDWQPLIDSSWSRLFWIQTICPVDMSSRNI